jgi:hypothetical protein
MEYLTIIISVLGVGGIVSGVMLRRLDRMEKKQDSREEARKQESVLVIKGLKAVGHLSEATAIAQKNGHTNGETDTALKYYKSFNDDLSNFLLRQNAERNHG